MIIVTGTKRSGTSMWMQILKAAGYPILGEAFPHDWEQTIRDANRAGFYESPLRRGIYYATNPNPRTGVYLRPDETRLTAVKVFVPGLVRSDMAYMYKVVATMRHYREYAASIRRLYQMEQRGRRALCASRGEPRPHKQGPVLIAPLLAWWNENYLLLQDALVRRYPVRMVSYASVLNAPERVLSETLSWLGQGDLAAAVGSVRGHLQTQRSAQAAAQPTGLGADVEAVFEELYQRIHHARPLDATFLKHLNRTHERLEPAIREAQARARAGRRRPAASAAKKSPSAAVGGAVGAR